MTTPRHVRTAAARLAGSVEERTGAVSSFRVGDAEYARLEGGEVAFWIGAHELERRRHDVPAARDAASLDGVAGMAVALADVNGMQVNALLTVAHALAAPAQATPQPPADGGDLPSGIGRPATRALHAAGIFTLTETAAHGRSVVAELHGVGPKAVRLLEQALDEAGLGWSGSDQAGAQQTP